jgi:F1F0 ATPase subunit 2
MVLELQALGPAFAAGLVLGAIFFGGLFWTVRRGLTAAQPALWFFGSLMLRTSVALLGFYLVGGTDWARWLLCLLGFVVARLAVHRLIRANVTYLTQKSRNAS